MALKNKAPRRVTAEVPAVSVPSPTEQVTAVVEKETGVALTAEQPVAEQPVAEQPVAEQPVAEQPVADALPAPEPLPQSLADAVAEEKSLMPTAAPVVETVDVSETSWLTTAVQVAKDTAPAGKVYERNPRSKPTKAGAAKAAELLCNRLRAEFPEGISESQLTAAVNSSLPHFNSVGNRAGVKEFMTFVTSTIAGSRGHFMMETGRTVGKPAEPAAAVETPPEGAVTGEVAIAVEL